MKHAIVIVLMITIFLAGLVCFLPKPQIDSSNSHEVLMWAFGYVPQEGDPFEAVIADWNMLHGDDLFLSTKDDPHESLLKIHELWEKEKKCVDTKKD